MRRLLALLALLALSCVPAAPSQPPPPAAGATGWGEPIQAGRYDAVTVDEASGLAASVRNPGVWWLLDDGRTNSVWAISENGATIGRVQLAGFRSRDAEDLAVGPCEAGRACVYVGDIGDNLRRRSDIRIARFVEPDLSAGVPAGEMPAEVIALRYPDAPADAEALLVDAEGTPYIVTKDPDDTRLFMAEGFAGGTLTDLGPVPVPRPPGLSLDGLIGAVTAADSRPGRVLLRTYGHAVEYIAPDPEAGLAEFAGWPAHVVPSAPQAQSESIAYASDGAAYATLSEGDPTIWLVRRDLAS
ncbi:MAG: hypothetical protein ACRD0K_24000 [Egibacteraceae bacterium]